MYIKAQLGSSGDLVHVLSTGSGGADKSDLYLRWINIACWFCRIHLINQPLIRESGQLLFDFCIPAIGADAEQHQVICEQLEIIFIFNGRKKLCNLVVLYGEDFST